MQSKIGLEEHFALPETASQSMGFAPRRYWPELRKRLLNEADERLRQMDTHGMEMMIISLNAPGVQSIVDPSSALELAQRANDFAAEEVARHPERLRALAALPMQDPQLAAQELQRCAHDLKLVGALVNGFTQTADGDTGLYYDHPQFRPFWGEAARLNMPFYLHPRNPLPANSRLYEGHEWLLGPTFAFAHETGTHALRLMGSGLFDEYPSLQVILGHLGEGLPAAMWRIDHRNGWVKTPPGHAGQHKIAHYFRNNFYLTTSANFSTPLLLHAMSAIGVDRVMFSTDWPFEDVEDASTWFDAAELSDLDRQKIGRNNAKALFDI